MALCPSDQMATCDSVSLLFLVFPVFQRVVCPRQCPSCCFQPLIDIDLIYPEVPCVICHTAEGLPKHLPVALSCPLPQVL